MMMGTPTSNVFTAAQWEELEQQALIYKYMVSGVPVPTELILSVRRSLFHSSSSSLNQPTLGVWEGSLGYNQLYQMGGGGRKIDLEPGRCRRTDGKKWRCSKEAYPDSKYCERHMHRGRNRSRKPVELSSSSSSSSSSSITPLTISKPISASDTYPLFSSNVNHGNFVDSASCYKDYRYLQGMNDIYTTQKMASSSACSSDQFNFQNLNDKLKDEEAERQHCFVMGTNFIKSSEDEEAGKSSTNRIVIKNDETLTTHKQPFHHFFSATNDPAWVEVDQRQNLINPPKSPLSTQDLFQSKPRPYW